MELSDEHSRTGPRETELRVEHSHRQSPGVVAFALLLGDWNRQSTEIPALSYRDNGVPEEEQR